MALRTGLRGFSPAIDRLLDHRIYAPHTVDAVLQDSALVVCPESYARLSAPPDVAWFRFDELPGRDPVASRMAPLSYTPHAD